ncbi:MAG: isopentenyl phosphate kinase [Omnitrophica WOR_2 bacterium]
MPSERDLNSSLSFLKLGGSLITDKTRPHTPRLGVIARLAGEIAAALNQDPSLSLVLGHGSGSFGHVPAKQYGTKQGVSTPEQWRGFVEVWREAFTLDRIVIDALLDAGVPAISLAPSAAVTAEHGRLIAWDLTPLRHALSARLVPVIYGDVIFDTHLGGTIFSTEDLFSFLARRLRPRRLLLAGREPGVWQDFPECQHLIPEINRSNLADIRDSLGESTGTDVTGGMAAKVHEMLSLVQDIPGLEVDLFSGETPGLVKKVLLGDRAGTLIG